MNALIAFFAAFGWLPIGFIVCEIQRVMGNYKYDGAWISVGIWMVLDVLIMLLLK